MKQSKEKPTEAYSRKQAESRTARQSPAANSPPIDHQEPLQMEKTNFIAETFDVTPVQTRQVLAPRVPAIAALAAARRAPCRRKKLKLRTRDSHASQLYNLELDVMDLKQEIQRLLEYQQLLNARTFNRRDVLDGYYVKVVMEYYRVFQNGYHPGSAIDAVQFVMQAMDEDIAIGRFAGRDVMLHQWEQYTKALSGLEFRYLRSKVLSTDEQSIVTSTASYKHVVTKDTLEVMFPQALRQYPRIASKMLGRVFHGEGQFNFTFDTKTHRIVSFNFELDFLQVFAHLLQDPRDLCAFFQGARISEECLIGDWACTKSGHVKWSLDPITVSTRRALKRRRRILKKNCRGVTKRATRSIDALLRLGRAGSQGFNYTCS